MVAGGAAVEDAANKQRGLKDTNFPLENKSRSRSGDWNAGHVWRKVVATRIWRERPVTDRRNCCISAGRWRQCDAV